MLGIAILGIWIFASFTLTTSLAMIGSLLTILSLTNGILIPQHAISYNIVPTFMDSLFGEVLNQDLVEKYASLSHLETSSNEQFTLTSIKYPNVDDTSDFQIDLLSGPVSFAHLPTANTPFGCFNDHSFDIDIAIVGAPFDSGVSYAPGARFGPNGVRQGSRRLFGGISPIRGNTPDSRLKKLDVYSVLNIMDCGDVPMTPFDGRLALNQLYRGHRAVHKHLTTEKSKNFNNTRIITLGGDHTISLMNIKSAWETFDNKDGLAIIHFDSHIDTWDPRVLGGNITKYASLNHGTFLHYAAEAGYVAHNHSVHVGIRAPYIAPSDELHDIECGFQSITSKDIDILSARGIGQKVKDIVGNVPVYLTFDLDTFDAPFVNSGTLEAGGFSSREIMTILDELEGLKIVGADIVEVSTPPNANGNDATGLLAAQVIDEIIGLMVVTELD